MVNVVFSIILSYYYFRGYKYNKLVVKNLIM